ncbi:MAG TPA: glycosyltransferase family A protein [Saprospiraceae bacterium]|nr:glycosyltransferase family A protein [Saprospiraceae bacterium]HMP13713.1 glycosyltransferase family A protein [Saprospiraceae bacterium]
MLALNMEKESMLRALLLAYHSLAAAKKRMRSSRVEPVYPFGDKLYNDLQKIASLSQEIIDYDKPLVSILLPVYNEEVEIIPTIVSLLYGIQDANIPTEIIAVNNNSTDRSADFLQRMGIRVVFCETPGLRFARNAGVQASHLHSKYVWLIDADTRPLPPLKNKTSLENMYNPLKVSYAYLEAHEDCIAVSTGIKFEYQVFLRRLIKKLRLLIKGGHPFSCWAGANQFIEKKHLMAIGGIDIEVDGGEDHHRVFQLIRYAKKEKLYLMGADRNPALIAPVYTSDRRNTTIKQILKNVIQQYRKPKYAKDEYGLPIHPKGVRHKDLYGKERGSAKF